jgi:hypothetical protein
LERLVTLSAVLAISFTQAQPSAAQASSAQRLGEARGFFALPVELDFDSGAANGDATILRMMPLYTFPVFDTWKLVNVTIFSMADAPGGIPEFPGDTSSGHTAGISDLLHASFVTPNRSGDFIWGAGVILALPIATDDSLGSDKWDAGPAFRLTYRKRPWNLGVIAGQRWSFAGSDNRTDVNQLLIRGAIRRQLPGDWFFVSAPLITANARRRRHWSRIQTQETPLGLVGAGLLQRHQAGLRSGLGASFRCDRSDSVRRTIELMFDDAQKRGQTAFPEGNRGPSP